MSRAHYPFQEMSGKLIFFLVLQNCVVENVSMMYESLAIYCLVHVDIVNCSSLRLMGASGQDELVLGTYPY